MVNDRTFHHYTYTLEVLSEQTLPANVDFDDLCDLDWTGDVAIVSLTPEFNNPVGPYIAAKMLCASGHDLSVLGLIDNGEDL